MVAGLERPDSGRIVYEDNVVADPARGFFVPPHRRNMGMVFQSYAIWPHMRVFDNVGYPLRVRGVPKAEQRARVERVLELVGLAGLGERHATMLSGGQQQRVALARALVYEPDLLLLDEPFSNLDAKLRGQMRLEVRELQRRLGITILFVTHDQIEALTLSDRIAVLNAGRIEQIGTPVELYDRPATAFVRDFLGQTVTIAGQVLRPEALIVEPERDGLAAAPGAVRATIAALLFAGERYEARLALANGAAIILALPRTQTWSEGQAVVLRLP
jgi:ABC-type Fe3+/spermidine/putrescine transport system ATPase subunit